jgi:hypothetical protein
MRRDFESLFALFRPVTREGIPEGVLSLVYYFLARYILGPIARLGAPKLVLYRPDTI